MRADRSMRPRSRGRAGRSKRCDRSLTQFFKPAMSERARAAKGKGAARDTTWHVTPRRHARAVSTLRPSNADQRTPSLMRRSPLRRRRRRNFGRDCRKPIDRAGCCKPVKSPFLKVVSSLVLSAHGEIAARRRLHFLRPSQSARNMPVRTYGFLRHFLSLFIGFTFPVREQRFANVACMRQPTPNLRFAMR